MINRTQTALAAILLAFTVGAQAQSQLEIRTAVQKEDVVVAEDGTERVELIEADTVLPGEEVVYTVTYENSSDVAAENVVITNPLPAELTYVAGTADGEGASVQFSADGGVTFAQAAELTVSDNGGERRAGPDEFTHIRWVLVSALQPGQTGTATFRARLN
ncbi:MAG: hypothetical protein AAGA44_15935 [Pseudomonadota bacterium]